MSDRLPQIEIREPAPPSPKESKLPEFVADAFLIFSVMILIAGFILSIVGFVQQGMFFATIWFVSGVFSWLFLSAVSVIIRLLDSINRKLDNDY